MIEPTQEQREIILRSLGLTNSKNSYRNYYYTRVGDPKLELMCTNGWMERGRKINEGRDQYYLVTDAGASAVGAKLPKE